MSVADKMYLAMFFCYCFQDVLLQNKVIATSFENNKVVLLLSKGLLTTLTINERSRDIVNITHNKQLVTKLGAEQICKGMVIHLFFGYYKSVEQSMNMLPTLYYTVVQKVNRFSICCKQ